MAVNTYDGITECYDLLMRAGYYEHDAMAKAANNVLGERTSVLELGVGTGLFAQNLAATNPSYEITGIDFTAPMLDIAESRIGDEVDLVEADVTEMDLGRTFDAAISSGGVWVAIRDGDDLLLGTHLLAAEADVRGLHNVGEHLEPDGLLLLSIQPMHRDFDCELDGGIVYSQRVEPGESIDDEHFTIEKQYSFTRDSEVLAEQTLELGFYRPQSRERILEEAGFTSAGADNEERFVVYSKEPA
ncbi:MAG: class I SAM-dependent methyltransferase [Acidimicrobiia bacterium]